MSQFDKINDGKEVISSNLENNNQRTESAPTKNAEDLKDREDLRVTNEIADQSRIDELKKELIGENNVNLIDSVMSKMRDGEQMYLALKHSGDETAINRRVESLTNEKASQLLTSMDSSYGYLIKASDEEVKAVYLKDFESQTSSHYLGGLMTAIDAEAFKTGFFNAKNGMPAIVNDKMNNIIKISERLLKAKTELSNSIKLENSVDPRKEISAINEKIFQGPVNILKTMTPEEVKAFCLKYPNQLPYLNSDLNNLSIPASIQNGTLVFENLMKYVRFLEESRGENYSSQILSSEELMELQKTKDEIALKI